MSYLYEEPLLLLRQEVQEPGIYSAVIEAIAMGYTKTNHLEKKILHERQSMVFRILCFVSGTDMYLQIVR